MYCDIHCDGGGGLNIQVVEELIIMSAKLIIEKDFG
jgi:hypothetical protein